MSFTERDGVRLHWEAVGTGSPVLLIMGASFSSRMWYPVVPALAERHRVITFDNRGTGESQATEVASIEDMAADARAVLEAAGEHSAHVYGISLGGVVAIEFALAYPDRTRSLVLGCTGILSRAAPRAPREADARFQLPRDVQLAGARQVLYGPACPPELADADIEVLRDDHADTVGLVAQQEALRAYAVEADEVGGIRAPTLVLHGTADVVVPVEASQELERVIPGARLKTYQDVGHSYAVAARDESNRDVLEFIADVEAMPSRGLVAAVES